MKVLSEKPLCFTLSLKEIAKNNMILSPEYYIEKKEHKKYNRWFSSLTLKQKNLLQSYHKFIGE